MRDIYFEDNSISTENFNFYDYKLNSYNYTLVLEEQWSNSYLSRIDRKVKSLSIFGLDKDFDLSFIIDYFPDIEQLFIQCKSVINFDVISQLDSLHYLSIICTKNYILQLELPNSLRSLTIDWKSKFQFMNYPSRLECLSINGGIRIDWDELFYNFKNLVKVDLEKCDIIDASLLFSLNRLKHLTIENCKVVDVSNTNFANCSVKYIHLLKIPISNLSFVKGFEALEVLICDNCATINSIRSISKLAQLRGLMLSGNTTIVDGDMSFLRKMKTLQNCFIVPNKHYSLKTIKPWNWKDFETKNNVLFN